MKKTKIISLIIAILVFVITLTNPLGGKENEISEEDLVPVVMAAERIGPQKILSQENLYVRKIHKDSVPEGAITDMNEVIGKVSHVNLFPDDVLNHDKIYEIGESAGGLSYIVEEGNRAVTVDIGHSAGLTGMLKVGNKVDIVGIMPTQAGEGEASDTMAKVIIEGAPIIALDRRISPSSSSGDGEGYGTITFELEPDEALDLSLAMSTVGDLRLLLRNQEDDGKLQNDRVFLKDIYK